MGPDRVSTNDEMIRTNFTANRTKTPNYLETYGKQTIQHLLLECLRFREEKKKLREKLEWMRIAWRLGNKNIACHIQYASYETGHAPILQLKSQFSRPGKLLNITLNHIIKTSKESRWFSLEIPLFRILIYPSVIKL